MRICEYWYDIVNASFPKVWMALGFVGFVNRVYCRQFGIMI